MAMSGAIDNERVGRLVDERYKILAPMAAGSMGAVYKAERVPVGKLVAIKFLHASFANDGEFLIRFERETQVMSRLAHPNCVSVVDFGVWEDSPYLVMDFVDGRTLRSIIDDGPIPIPRALALARQIAAGLAHAHTHEVVHRDVKPANIMVSDEIGTGERVRVLDFGLARLRHAGGRDATQTNVVVGTPNYMAPEQTVAGGLVDARTDIYATGVTLFEMIVGEKPFAAEETLQLLGMHRAAPIPRLAARMDEGTVLPDGLQDIIDACMAKKPDDRFQTAVELADAIGVVLQQVEHAAGKVSGELKLPGSAAMRTVAPSVQRNNGSPTAMAKTLPDIRQPPAARPWRAPLLGALILLVGVGAGAAYMISRGDDVRAASKGSAPGSELPGTGSGSQVATLGSDALPDAPDSADAMDGSASALVADSGSGSGSGSDGLGSSGSAGAGSSSVDGIEIDPETADDPNPNPNQDATDEASDAPKNSDEAEKAVVVQDALAKTVPDAIALIKSGKRELAIKSLEALRTKVAKNGYVPFLIGNLYFDKVWWGVAMDYYKVAIAQNAAYKRNAILNNNVITTLASTSTRRRAQSFLRFTVGAPAGAYLRNAAKHHKNSIVRQQAAALAKYIR